MRKLIISLLAVSMMVIPVALNAAVSDLFDIPNLIDSRDFSGDSIKSNFFSLKQSN